MIHRRNTSLNTHVVNIARAFGASAKLMEVKLGRKDPSKPHHPRDNPNQRGDGVFGNWTTAARNTVFDGTTRCSTARGSNATSIIVLSYPWLDRHHPDKHGATLQRILPILRGCLEDKALARCTWVSSLPLTPDKTTPAHAHNRTLAIE